MMVAAASKKLEARKKKQKQRGIRKMGG